MFSYSVDGPLTDQLTIYGMVHWERDLTHRRAAAISGWFIEPNTCLFSPGMHILFVTDDHHYICERTTEVALCYSIVRDIRHTWVWVDEVQYQVMTDWRAVVGENGMPLHRKFYERQFGDRWPKPTYWFALLEQEIYNMYARMHSLPVLNYDFRSSSPSSGLVPHS